MQSALTGLLGFWILFGNAVPAYVIGRRSGLTHTWIAFIPLLGSWIALSRSVERSGWMALWTLIPIAAFIFVIWIAFELPSDHGRSGWWTAALLIPLVNLVGYWAYAFTMPRHGSPQPTSPAVALV